MIKLEEMGVGGRMFNWINDFLKQRVIRVRVGDYIISRNNRKWHSSGKCNKSSAFYNNDK